MNYKHILVVEDEIDIQGLVKFNLPKEGYKVSVFTSCEEGLNAERLLKPVRNNSQTLYFL